MYTWLLPKIVVGPHGSDESCSSQCCLLCRQWQLLHRLMLMLELHCSVLLAVIYSVCAGAVAGCRHLTVLQMLCHDQARYNTCALQLKTSCSLPILKLLLGC